MIRKYLTVVLILLLIQNKIYGQNPEIINFEKVYDFLNSTITNDMGDFNLSENPTFGIFGDDTTSIFTDTLFDNADRDYLRQQLSILEKAKWPENTVTGARLIPEEKINRVFKSKNGWDKFRNKYGNCLTSFSFPIFNKSYTYCVFYHWTQCDYLAGSGSLDLYKLENGNWILVKMYMMGVS